MQKIFNLENIWLLVIFTAPLYLLRMRVFGLPTNAHEILLFGCLCYALITKKAFPEKIFGLPKIFLTSSVLILIGITISFVFNPNYAGLGIFKSWFILPMIFGYLLYVNISHTKQIENIFNALFFSAVSVACVALVYKILGTVTFDNRLQAFYLSPNHLAMYLTPGLFGGLFLLQKEYSATNRGPKFLAYCLFLLLIALALFFTYSYAALIAVFLSFSVSAFFNKISFRKKYLLFFSFLLLLIFMALGNIDKYSALAHFDSRSSLASRIIIWRSSLFMIKQHPLVGIGPGNFQRTYLALQPNFPPYLEWAVPQPHNIFLAFWLETGAVGLIGFLLLVGYLLITLFHLVKKQKNTALTVPLLAFFFYLILHGLADTPYWKNDLAFLFWIYAFSVIALKKIPSNSSMHNVPTC